jgi:hypothetical protein
MSSNLVARLRFALVAIAIAALAACGHFGLGGPDPSDALIVFQNQSLDQADVFAVAPGSDFSRIGTVFPGRTDTLRVPRSMLTGSGVNIVARLLARSFTPSSGVLSLNPGDIFQVTLNPDGRNLVALPAR